MHDGKNRGAMLGGWRGGEYEVAGNDQLRAPSLRYYYCMTDSNVVPFPKDQRDTREPSVPLITAVGTILVERDKPLDDGATDDDCHEKAGEIRIAKAFVDTTDIVLAMDALTSDHEFLASQIIDGMFYEQELADWFGDEFGVMLGGDPVFVLDFSRASLGALWPQRGERNLVLCLRREPGVVVRAGSILDRPDAIRRNIVTPILHAGPGPRVSRGLGPLSEVLYAEKETSISSMTMPSKSWLALNWYSGATKGVTRAVKPSVSSRWR